MKLKKLCLLLFMPLLISSCALNYSYTYQPESQNTGKAVIIPTAATSNTYVMLNDSLILKNKVVKSLTLENLPAGDYILQYKSYNSAYKEKLEKQMFLRVENGSNLTEIVGVPPVSSGYWIYAGLITATIYAVLYIPLIFAK
ncbi:MAG TPA: hypothetical protein P5084_00475 [Paludibacter sp.]|nr:hypothetical protein [Paludibacter sp.]